MLRSVRWLGAIAIASAAVAFSEAEEPAASQAAEPGAEVAAKQKASPDGREIFERVWTAEDPRSHSGDGVGPVFNAKSCVACHEQGGAGGGGGFDDNVTLLSLDLPPLPIKPERAEEQTDEQYAAVVTAFETNHANVKAQRENIRKQAAERFHPDFATSDTIVVHRFGTDEKAHEQWKAVSAGPNIKNLSGLVAPVTSGIGPNTIVSDTQILSIQQPVNVNQLHFVNGLNVLGPFVDPNTFPILAELSTKIQQARNGANNTGRSFAFNGAAMRISQRNTTALWGAGLIDRIPAKAIEAIAAAQQEAGGRISGRVVRFADGRVGRFGWKGQKATLHDFTMAACANELGLEVPGEHQAKVAYRKDYQPKGLDLDERQVDALVDYIAEFPAPIRNTSDDDAHAKLVADGAKLFTTAGCATCHVEDVGGVEGLYSDLLIHDMGNDLGSIGSYGVPSFPEQEPEDVPIADAGGKPKAVSPTSREWRTPPLWGVGSSAPYLHDGRAKTIAQAIAFHGGEAAESRLRFMLLSEQEQKSLVAFLESLTAPQVAARK